MGKPETDTHLRIVGDRSDFGPLGLAETRSRRYRTFMEYRAQRGLTRRMVEAMSKRSSCGRIASAGSRAEPHRRRDDDLQQASSRTLRCSDDERDRTVLQRERAEGDRR